MRQGKHVVGGSALATRQNPGRGVFVVSVFQGYGQPQAKVQVNLLDAKMVDCTKRKGDSPVYLAKRIGLREGFSTRLFK